MSGPFSDHPFLKGNFAPIHTEYELPSLSIQGEIPPSLQGALYRIGPNPQFPPRDRYHWFAGDGMVHAFHIAEGRVSYGNRWVRTEKWRLENAAGRALFGSFGNPLASDPSVMGRDGGLANTNIVHHAGRLLALEEAHPPTELDPANLETRGYFDFAGRLKGAMTAHPKTDPRSGELIFFAYNAMGRFTPWIAWHKADAVGRLTASVTFETPFASMVHDFMVTENHVLFPVLPLVGDLRRAMAGGSAYAWEPERGSHVAIMPRDGGPEDVKWFTGPPAYVFHPVNAWEEQGRILADVMQYERAPLFPDLKGHRGDPAKSLARLHRWRFDLAGWGDRIEIAPLDDLAGEFPRIDERFLGRAYRHCFYAYFREGEIEGLSTGLGGLAHLDVLTGRRRRYDLPAGDAVSEPVFVPRSPEAAEGDGYLLAVIYRAREAQSELAVFDTDDIGRGPVALARLTHRLPHGFHGNWLAA